MDLQPNTAEPLLMHIDLNSCFAMMEQQAHPHLRGVPVGVAANVSPGGCVISPSYEAKRLGIKVGFRVRDALEVCPDMVILPPDPDLYFDAHARFVKIFRTYSPSVTPKSIDEAVIDFSGTPALRRAGLIEIGTEIKKRMKDELGEFVTCNIGIGTNRFLAKTAAGLNKPDGMDVITYENLEEVYSGLTLRDLCGINYRFEARLNNWGIYSPLEFLQAPLWKLHKQVFQSVGGYYWYLRLRGFEIDAVEFGRKSYGQSYALHYFTADTHELSKLLMKLCEKMGRRLRRSGSFARGISVFCGFRPGSWHESKLFPGRNLYATLDLFEAAMQLLAHRPLGLKATHIAVSCYDLAPVSAIPTPLFTTPETFRIRLAAYLDAINDKWGEYTVHPATMMNMQDQIIKRVPFHATRDTLTEIYSEPVSVV
jgi:DNA polymerase-4